MKECLHCQGENLRRGKYCSDKCRWKVKDNRRSLERKGSIKDKACEECKTTFTPTCNHPRYKFCSSKCKDKNNKIRYALDGRSKLWKKLPKEHTQELHRKYYHDPSTGRKEQVIENNAIRRSLQRKSSLFDTELTSLVFNEGKSLCRLRYQSTGIEWHVDHIIPLRGAAVCGLHVWNNFRIIPKLENLKKGNKTCLL